MAREPEPALASVTAVPMPIRVQEAGEHRPLNLTSHGDNQRVVTVDDRGEVQEDWWKDNTVVRMYYRVTLEKGRRLTIFQNMVHVG